ncbi:MAG: hypothetical protein HRU03_08595, partial [Nanoarchaeales archaeon]|nr:hypothetical protein [Nanoarchaeales archaeon]
KNKSAIEAVVLLRKYTRIDSYILFKQISEKSNNNKKIILEFLDFLNSLGFGFVELKKLGNKNIIFTINQIFMSNMYKNLFGKFPEVLVEEYLSGFLENFLSSLYGIQIIVNLEISNNSLIFNCVVSDKPYTFKTNNVYDSQNYKTPTESWIHQLILQKKIISCEGKLGFNGNYVVVIPVFFMLEKVMASYELDLNILKNISSMYTYNFIKLISNYENFNCKTAYDMLLANWSLVGVGTVELDSVDLLSFEFKNNIYSYFKQFYPKNLFVYLEEVLFSSFKGVYDFSNDKTTELTFNDDLTRFKLKVVADSRELSDIENEIISFLSVKNFIVKL